MNINVNIPDQDVNKIDLVTILTENRDNHQAMYEAANSGYRKAAESQLRHRARKIHDGGEVKLSFSLSAPESHTDEYDTVIGLLNLSTAVTVKLGLQDYRKLVQDKWDWSYNFGATYSGYCPTV